MMTTNDSNKRPYIGFRPGSLLKSIQARLSSVPTGDEFNNLSTSEIAKRDLERYYTTLANDLASVTLSVPEASLIVDACNGVAFVDPMTIRFLWAEVADAIRLNELDKKWHVDRNTLVRNKLQNLTFGQTTAIVDAAERFWSLVGHGDARDTEELLREVGLIAPSAAVPES